MAAGSLALAGTAQASTIPFTHTEDWSGDAGNNVGEAGLEDWVLRPGDADVELSGNDTLTHTSAGDWHRIMYAGSGSDRWVDFGRWRQLLAA